jgi:toxin YoeB
MARQIVWTEKAQANRIALLSYWNKRNKSTQYSQKLNELLRESLLIISKHPFIGRSTDKENVRVKVLKGYLIFYEITVREIVVLLIWDCRQNPEDFKI